MRFLHENLVQGVNNGYFSPFINPLQSYPPLQPPHTVFQNLAVSKSDVNEDNKEESKNSNASQRKFKKPYHKDKAKAKENYIPKRCIVISGHDGFTAGKTGEIVLVNIIILNSSLKATPKTVIIK